MIKRCGGLFSGVGNRKLRVTRSAVGAAVSMLLAGPALALGAIEAGVNPNHLTHTTAHAGCFSCAVHGPADATEGSAGFADFQIATRWNATAQEPIGFRPLGTPVRLTWGFAREGSTINSTRAGEATGPSSLVAFLDGIRDPASTGGTDLTQRAWFNLFADSFARIEELSGVSYVYEPNDDGATISGAVNAGTVGILGTRADVRIAGHAIDGQSGSNTLAYNYFPAGGDMVLDTDNVNLYSSTFFNSLQFRQVVMHEALHGLGLSHVESNNSNQLMEPFLSIAFDGPQFDDILGLHRNYGDAREKNGGNDTLATADFLGSFLNGDDFALGTDAGNTSVVTPGMTDFVSIDDDSDRDVFRFTVTQPTLTLTATLTPRGPTYNQAPQTDPATAQTPLITSALSDLVLELLDAGGNVIIVADQTVAGGTESIASAVITAGDWFLRVTGKNNAVQMYSLGLLFVPEPATALMLLLWPAAAGRRPTRDRPTHRRL